MTQASSPRHYFQIPIGDWSGDGHDKCDFVRASAAKPVEAAREAYFAAQRSLPDLDPVKFCERYEDRKVPAPIAAVFAAQQIRIDPNWLDSHSMAQYVAWYLNQGDPDLGARIEDPDPMLPFYGFDDRGRHIDFMGYGLFS